MNSLLAVCIPVAAVLSVASAGHAETAQEMLSHCRPTMVAEIPTEGLVTLEQTFSTGMCWGGFSAIQKLINLVGSDEKAILGVCTPAESRRGQLIAVFGRYAEAHPEQLHEDWPVIALFALREAFPCHQ